jgi:ribosome-associated heat shock protein Hsp15
VSEAIRLDKWLWQARFFKSRALSAQVVRAGRVRVDGTRVSKPATKVAPGATLTFPQAKTIRVVRITQIGTRRGPASEAQTLYDDLTPAPDPAADHPAGAEKGRPSRKARHNLKLNLAQTLE